MGTRKIIFFAIAGIFVLIGVFYAFIGDDLERNIGLAVSSFCGAIILHEATKQKDKI